MTNIANELNGHISVRNLLTVPQFSQKHPAFSQSALRHLIFDAENNGFCCVVKRVGKRKILLDEHSFFQWVDEQQKQEGRK
ncbi:MAG: hypothetical protein K1000chlam3_00137 [Chlamydiae bacterium]|nr:hypothetical protein [Chlamydiota bacterium]